MRIYQERQVLLELGVRALQQPVEVVLPLENSSAQHVRRQPEVVLEHYLRLSKMRKESGKEKWGWGWGWG